MSLAKTVAGYGFFLFAAALGAAVRYRTKIRIRDIDQAKAREREQLARELHDTVAHHVSGIDRKSTRLNSSHANISYAVFCLKKKTQAPITRLAFILINPSPINAAI